VKKTYISTRPSGTESAPTESLLSVMRLLGLGGRRLSLKIVAFTLLSMVGALSQAVLLLVIAEVAVADVQGKGKGFFHDLGPTLSHKTAAIVLGVALVLFFSTSILSTLISTGVSKQALTVTRTRVVTGFFQSSWSLQSTERLGHLQQLLTMNSGATAGAVGSLSSGLQSFLMMAVLLGVALAVDPAAAIGVIVIGFVLLQILMPIRVRSRQANRDLSKFTRAMATRVTEYTRVSRDFRLFGVEKRVMKTLRGLIEEAGDMYRRASILGSIAPVVYQTVALGIVIVIVFVGSSHASFAKNSVVLILVLRSVGYGSTFQSSIQGLRSSQGMLEDLTYDIHRFDDARITPGKRMPETFDVDFDCVEYSYDGMSLALGGITMHIPQGKILGMLGPSGSGKTTISQILLGLREPTSGQATMGGVDAAAISKGDAHNMVALVPQEPVLLQGSVSDNIRFFRDFEDQEVIEAAKSAHLHDDVAQMPEGYETLVGEGGGSLSGGQKQPTSAVDGRTERLIRQTLSELRGHVTVVIISHRIETTSQCDLLLVLSDGKVADFGERDDVLAGSAYKDIVLCRI
jgi:ATP-binding cassette subfamily B protein